MSNLDRRPQSESDSQLLVKNLRALSFRSIFRLVAYVVVSFWGVLALARFTSIIGRIILLIILISCIEIGVKYAGDVKDINGNVIGNTIDNSDWIKFGPCGTGTPLMTYSSPFKDEITGLTWLCFDRASEIIKHNHINLNIPYQKIHDPELMALFKEVQTNINEYNKKYEENRILRDRIADLKTEVIGCRDEKFRDYHQLSTYGASSRSPDGYTIYHNPNVVPLYCEKNIQELIRLEGKECIWHMNELKRKKNYTINNHVDHVEENFSKICEDYFDANPTLDIRNQLGYNWGGNNER